MRIPGEYGLRMPYQLGHVEGFRQARDEGCEEAYRLWVDDTGETDFDTFRDAWWARLTVRRLLRLSSPVIPACWLTCRRRWRSILTMRRMRGIYSWTPSPLLTVMCSVGDLLPRSGGGMACQAAGKPWQAYACLKCRRAAPAALPFLPVMV
uniref:Uncharacterized protein n=17 Tax=Enterobacterales TaxID=91347 RepID=A0A2H5C5L7_ECOLX|nr:hypothetical protein PCOV24_00156 [Escherichia coli]